MTQIARPVDLPSPRAQRSELALAELQLTAIDRFNRARQLADRLDAVVARSREAQLDASRRGEVRRREHEALVARVDQHLRSSGEVLRASVRPRAVVAHRSDWFVARVRTALEERGVRVVASVDNGAEAVGTVVAEQPDLVLVEDSLPMVPGHVVVRELVQFCPGTRITAQVAYGDRIAALKDAGATTVVTRQVPPADVVQQMLAADPARPAS